MSEFPSRIISGGQTGVDRAALDAAILLGIPHGGWCPRGRLAEDGPIAAKYLLTETELPHYHVRTERNVIDANATLILFATQLSGGTALTMRLAAKHRRPCFSNDLDENVVPEFIQSWLDEHRVYTLNVAGPRESSAPGIHEMAQSLLLKVLTHDPPGS